MECKYRQRISRRKEIRFMKLLMHACCAPCSVYCVDTLRKEGIEPTLYWFNPNIHPYMEYRARRGALEEYSKMMNLECIFDDNYGLDEFYGYIAFTSAFA